LIVDYFSNIEDLSKFNVET